MPLNSQRGALPYTGLKVVDTAGDVGGEMCGKLLAEMGAEVVKVEPPSGSPTRRIGPFANGRDDGDHSLTFWYYNLGKKSVVIDEATSEGREELHSLLLAADVLVSTEPLAQLERFGLGPDRRLDGNPGLIVVSVMPFGLEGPWASYRSSDLVALAAGGPLHMCGYDDHSIPPICPGGNQGHHTAASFAHIGLLLALIDREFTGVGQLVDVSMHESLAVTVELANPYWFYPKAIVKRQTGRHAQPVATQPALFEAGDGRYIYFLFIVSEQKAWTQLVAWLESKDLATDLSDSAYLEFAFRQKNYAHVQEVLECFFLLHDGETLYREGQEYGLAIGIVNAPDDLLNDAHLLAREFFTSVMQDDGQVARFPGAPYRFSALRQEPHRRAPRLGEHTGKVLDHEIQPRVATEPMGEP